jgi:hypothetical protein
LTLTEDYAIKFCMYLITLTTYYRQFYHPSYK